MYKRSIVLAACATLVVIISAIQAGAQETKLTWFGHAAFSITTPNGKVLIIDPWLRNPANPDVKAGKDPLALRLALTKDKPRANAVLKAVAEMSDFGKKRSGRGLGLACSDYHDTLTAGIAEVSIDRATGKIKVHNYWIAADPGLVVQPDNALAQIESAVIYVLSGALSEELTVKDGAVQQSNFGDYHVLRMSDVPQIHVRILTTNNPPTGVGQMATPLVAPAIANAVAELTGVRLRETPMTPERVKKALG